MNTRTQRIAGVLMAIFALGFFQKIDIPNALLCIVGALVLLPTSRLALEQRLKRELSQTQVIGVSVACLVLAFAIPSNLRQQIEDDNREAKKETKKENKIEDTNTQTENKMNDTTKAQNTLPTEKDIAEAKVVGTKYGLPEEKRKEIFEELVWAERKAISEAEKVHDLSKMEGTAQQKLETFSKYKGELEEKYKGNISEKYKLSAQQIKMIYLEHTVKNWALPPMK